MRPAESTQLPVPREAAVAHYHLPGSRRSFLPVVRGALPVYLLIDQSTNQSVWQCSLSFIDDQEIDFHHVGICDGEGLSPWNQLSEEVVITAVQLILNPKVPPHNTTSNTNRI